MVLLSKRLPSLLAVRPVRRRKILRSLEGYLFISPWIIGSLAFSLGPILAALGVSFMRWTIEGTPRFIGLSNYVTMFTYDPRYLKSLRVTLTYVLVGVPLQLLVALGMAVLLNQRVKGQNVFRTIFYMPAVVSGVAASILWQWMFQPDFGIINNLLKTTVGIQGPQWLYSEEWALPSMMIMKCWGVGATMVIFLAVLQDVPQHLYEAAELDGAGRWSKFRHVTLPMISPVIFFNMVMGIIGGFQTFTPGYVMTRGGPADATLFYALYLYYNAFEYSKMGYAAAMAWVLFVIILVITLIQFWGSRRWVYYYAGEAR